MKTIGVKTTANEDLLTRDEKVDLCFPIAGGWEELFFGLEQGLDVFGFQNCLYMKSARPPICES